MRISNNSHEIHVYKLGGLTLGDSARYFGHDIGWWRRHYTV